MGQTCSACQANSNQPQIKNLPDKTAQSAVPDMLIQEKENSNPILNSKGSRKSDKVSKKPDAVASSKNKREPSPTSQPAEDTAENQIIDENKGEKAADMNSFVSQPIANTKPMKQGVKLAEMPDYLNPLTKQRLEKLPKFEYNKPEYEVQGAELQGPIQFDSKYVYQGQWKDGKRAGRGKQLWRDGSYYQGYWKNNMASGYGRLIHTDGDTYEGQWVDDRAEGTGIYSHICGAVFKGSWKNDKQQGYGEEVWPDNAVYKGQYVSGKKHGKGKFEWSDNSCYEGEFVDNNISGYGKYKWRDGRVFQGTWEQNKMEGKGVFLWPDGRKYEGEYKNDKKHGIGTFYWPDGRVYKGEWADGKQHGKGEYKSKKGSVREGLWENGVRTKWLNEDPNKNSTTFSSEV